MLAPTIQRTLKALASEPSLLQERAQDVLRCWDNLKSESPDEIADLYLASERLAKIKAAGRENDAALIATLDAVQPADWYDMPQVPCDIGKQRTLAKQMLNALEFNTPPHDAFLRINAGLLSRYPAEAAIAHCVKHGTGFDLDIDDEAFDTALIGALNAEELTGLIALRVERLGKATHNMRIAKEFEPEQVEARKANAEKFARYNAESTRDYYRRVGDGSLQWNLTYIPTPEEARIDGQDYPAYLDFFFEACDQPWGAIQTAQKHLAQAFNKAQDLHITNSDGTDIRMSLAGHTFANSVIAHNIPGSEIFSGPVKESVNGVIVAKGNFAMTSPLTAHVKDMTLRFEHGRVVEAHAAEGEDDLHKVLGYDDAKDPADKQFEGSRHVGEIGIGTNPHIRNHSVNGLLVEKIGGSFHVALGKCYGNTYLGEEALMANGNKSDVHWDLTTMLRGREGRMYLDGHLVQKDGEWVDCPELGLNAKEVDVLNRGWAAIPEHQRPKYWREKLAAETQVTR